MAEPLVKELNLKTPTRNQLSKTFADHEVLIYFERLFRATSDLVPADIETIFQELDRLDREVVTVQLNYEVPAGKDYSVLANASVNNITITLPSAALSRTRIVGITKTDATSNIITIQGQTGELVVGEVSQALLAQYEVLNFISDGENWQLAN